MKFSKSKIFFTLSIFFVFILVLISASKTRLSSKLPNIDVLATVSNWKIQRDIGADGYLKDSLKFYTDIITDSQLTVATGGTVLINGPYAGVQINSRTGTGPGMQWYNPLGTDLRLWSYTNNDVLTVTNGGNVGIGTTNPNAALHVMGAVNTDPRPAYWTPTAIFEEPTLIDGQLPIELRINGTTKGIIRADWAGNAVLSGTGAGATYLSLNGSGGIMLGNGALSVSSCVSSTGWLNIGSGYMSTCTSSYPLEVNGNAETPVKLRNTATAIGKHWKVGPDQYNNFIVYNQGWVGMYMSDGATSWTPNSDQRVKTNIRTLSDQDGLKAIEKLNPVSFNWKSTAASKTIQLGFVAQQVQKIFPQLVSYGPDTTLSLPDGSKQEIKKILGLNYEGLIPPLVKAVQEINQKSSSLSEKMQKQEEKIKKQQKEIENLKSEISEIKKLLKNK